MSFPKSEHPLFKVRVPSLNREVKMRPMLVKEEKILLTAKESGEFKDVLLAVKQIVQNCLSEPDVKVDDLKLFDVEYLYLQIYAASVDNVSSVVYKDDEDEKEYPFKIKLDEVKVDVPDNPRLVIDMGEGKGINVSWPSAALYEDSKFDDERPSEEVFQDFLIQGVLVSYFEGDKVHKFADHKKDEVVEFIDNLDIKTYNKVKDFVGQIPSLYYKLEYKNTFGKDKTIELRSLLDFFIL